MPYLTDKAHPEVPQAMPELPRAEKNRKPAPDRATQPVRPSYLTIDRVSLTTLAQANLDNAGLNTDNFIRELTGRRRVVKSDVSDNFISRLDDLIVVLKLRNASEAEVVLVSQAL